MASAVDGTSPPSVPPLASSRATRFDGLLVLRAAWLAIIGFAITFTAPLHENVVFNRTVFVVLCVGLVGLGVAALVRAQRAEARQIAPAALGALTLIAGIVAVATSSQPTFALILIVWAAGTAIIELLAGLRTGNRESVTTGTLAAILALALTVFGGDPVSVIGFLGAYTLVVAVYLAIAAFDHSPATGATPTLAPHTDTEIAGSAS